MDRSPGRKPLPLLGRIAPGVLPTFQSAAKISLDDKEVNNVADDRRAVSVKRLVHERPCRKGRDDAPARADISGPIEATEKDGPHSEHIVRIQRERARPVTL